MSPTLLDSLFINNGTRRYLPSNEFVLPMCKVGVELELEHMEHVHYVSEITHLVGAGFLEKKEDHSLRFGGLELVTGTQVAPLFGWDLSHTLSVLESTFRECCLKPKLTPLISERCSTHVHIDLLDMTLDEILDFILICFVVEDAIFEKYSPNRKRGPYCRSIAHYPHMSGRIHNLLFEKKNLRLGLTRFFSDCEKYDAINWSGACTRGTVEFRMFGGTTDMLLVREIINLLMGLKKAAMSEKRFLTKLLSPSFCHSAVVEHLFGKEENPFQNQKKDLLRGVVRGGLLSNEVSPTVKRKRKPSLDDGATQGSTETIILEAANPITPNTFSLSPPLLPIYPMVDHPLQMQTSFTDTPPSFLYHEQELEELLSGLPASVTTISGVPF